MEVLAPNEKNDRPDHSEIYASGVACSVHLNLAYDSLRRALSRDHQQMACGGHYSRCRIGAGTRPYEVDIVPAATKAF